MNPGVPFDLKRLTRDFAVGLIIFTVVAMLLLGGELPPELPSLSSNVHAAEWLAQDAGQANQAAFRFTAGWSALAVMAVMFATLYAFNVALFRRLQQKQVLARKRFLSTR